MIFYTPSDTPRPMRLDGRTRDFAVTSLDGVYGRDALSHPAAVMDNVAGFADMSLGEKYNAAVLEIARTAPVVLREDEELCGSATLGLAISHVVPATFGGTHILGSISHLTADFFGAVTNGVEYTESLVRDGLSSSDGRQREVYEGMDCALRALRIWHSRYIKALEYAVSLSEGEDKVRLEDTLKALRVVPFAPARTFRQALQSVWFCFAFMRLCGNWPGIGRLDAMLSPFLERELKEGTLTEKQARELLAHFFIKGCEWITGSSNGSGDAQHYQNIVLGGIDEDGAQLPETAARLILEVVEELPISDYPIAVRINKNTSEGLLRLIGRVISHGGGVVAVYGEDTVIKVWTDAGVPLRDARRFANDGCWEVQVPGETCFSYHPIDGYMFLQDGALLLGKSETPDYTDFEGLYAAFRQSMTDYFSTYADNSRYNGDPNYPTGVVDIFERGCALSGRSYFDHGPNYTVRSPHFGGLADAANSLFVIKKLVYEEKRLSLPELIGILRKDWEGEEELRLYIRNRVELYGNDGEADVMAARILNDWCDIIRDMKGDMLFVPGVSTFGRQIEWRDTRYSHAHGFKKGDILASNASPTPGTDTLGATAVINSHCKLPLHKLTGGTALDLKLDPSCLSGGAAESVVPALIKGFVEQGGNFLQIDVLDSKALLDAQLHPELYRTLSVRLSGWSARFVTLDKSWQDMIIARTVQRG
ncbi:MAG: pyruvate formate lyase family protein [Eubacteriales bacterium]